MLCVAISSGMEYGAVDALGTILFVDQALIAIDNHNKVIVVSDWQTSHGFHALAIEIHGVFAAQVGDSVIDPFAIPALIGHFLLKFLSRQERAPEDIWSALRVGYIRWEDDFSIRGAGINNWAIDGLARKRDFSHPSLPHVTDSLLSAFARQVWKRLLDQPKKHLVIVPVNNKVR